MNDCASGVMPIFEKKNWIREKAHQNDRKWSKMKDFSYAFALRGLVLPKGILTV